MANQSTPPNELTALCECGQHRCPGRAFCMECVERKLRVVMAQRPVYFIDFKAPGIVYSGPFGDTDDRSDTYGATT